MYLFNDLQFPALGITNVKTNALWPLCKRFLYCLTTVKQVRFHQGWGMCHYFSHPLSLNRGLWCVLWPNRNIHWGLVGDSRNRSIVQNIEGPKSLNPAQQQSVELDYAAIIQDHEFAWWNVSVNGLHISLGFELRFSVHFVTWTDGWMLLLYWYVLHVSLSRALFIAFSER